MNEKEYSYPRKFLYNRMPVIMMYVIITVFVPTAIINVVDIFTGKFSFASGELFDLIIVLISPIAFTILFSIDLNMLPSFKVDEDGLNVNLFNYRWLWTSISWNQITGIEEMEKTYRGQRVWCIGTNTDLTYWHKILSKKYCGEESSKKIFFSGLLENLNDMVENIEYFITLDQVEK